MSLQSRILSEPDKEELNQTYRYHNNEQEGKKSPKTWSLKSTVKERIAEGRIIEGKIRF